jgi:hypothetical protein
LGDDIVNSYLIAESAAYRSSAPPPFAEVRRAAQRVATAKS